MHRYHTELSAAFTGLHELFTRIEAACETLVFLCRAAVKAQARAATVRGKVEAPAATDEAAMSEAAMFTRVDALLLELKRQYHQELCVKATVIASLDARPAFASDASDAPAYMQYLSTTARERLHLPVWRERDRQHLTALASVWSVEAFVDSAPASSSALGRSRTLFEALELTVCQGLTALGVPKTNKG
jgi:hypothetical protein